MTEQKIRDKAPSGATHYELDGRSLYYYKLKEFKLFIYNNRKGWILKPIEWLSDTKPL